MRQFLLAILTCLSFATLSAQLYLGVATSAMATWQTDNLDFTQTQPGGGATLGGVIQYNIRHFYLRSGVSLEYFNAIQKISNTDFNIPMQDAEGISFIYRGEIQNRRDNVRFLEISIPLILGAQLQHFYFGGGIRAVFPTLSRAQQKAQYMTLGDYEGRYYEDLSDMPQHGFYDYRSITTGNTLSLQPDIRICFETGAIVNTKIGRNKYSDILKIGLYAEYGLLNTIKNNGNLELNQIDLSPFPMPTINNVYTTTQAGAFSVHNIMLGLHIAWLFPISNTARHSHNKCMCF